MEFERVGNGILNSLGGFGDILADKMTMVAIVLGLLFFAGTLVKMRRRRASSTFNFPIVAPPNDLPTPEQLEIKRILAAGNANNVTTLNAPTAMVKQTTHSGPSQPADGLNFVSTSDLKLRSILNSSAHPILTVMEAAVNELHAGLRVMAQLSLDKMVTSRDAETQAQAKAALNGKTLEFVVVDRFGMAVLAAEQASTDARSGDEYIARATLIEALRKAGVTYMEIPRDYSQSGLRQQVSQILAKYGHNVQTA